MVRRRVRVLLVEDRLSDQVIIKRSLEDGEIDCELTLVENGVEAINYLEQYKLDIPLQSYMPDLVLMDINMPVMNGKEALQVIRANPIICHIPIIMLTTSNYEKDVLESYQLGVNAYLTKPIEHQKFLEVILQIEQFWLKVVDLPESEIRENE